jgi:uncharacterized protein YjiS (DUF1127 family)
LKAVVNETKRRRSRASSPRNSANSCMAQLAEMQRELRQQRAKLDRISDILMA